jgi:hypothetical protein
MRQVAQACFAFLLTVSLAFGQSAVGTRASTSKKTASGPSVSSRLEQMEKALQAQQQQISQLQDQLKSRDSQVQQLQQQLTQTQSSVSQAEEEARAAAAKGVQPEQLDGVKRDVADLQNAATNSALTLQETQKTIKDMDSPLAIRFKGITITPGGFLAAETVYRNRALGADINTPFNGLNMPGSGQNAISEFYGSGRQSRVTLLGEGKVRDAKLTGYYEADFLSAAVTSNNNESNSYSMRQRQLWGQLALTNGWSLTGGQMWSLATETKKGMDNRSEALPMTIDPQYTVGFSWARQYGFRAVKNFNNHVWLGASLENPSTTFAARNNASNFAIGGPGNGGGLYNSTANYSFNATPDFIVKAAFEPGFGHYEIFGIFSRFRDRVYPCAEPPADLSLCNGGVSSPQGAFNSSRNGGGVGANARITLAKQVDVGVHGLMGNGVGRYGTAGLPDATVNADGTLALLRSYQGLGTLEWHKPRFDVYLNAGAEYIGRRSQTDPISLKEVGYGSPLFDTADCYAETLPGGNGFTFGTLPKCQADTRVVVEGTFGFWIKLYNGPRGRLQFGPQYSYVTRNTWSGTGGAPHGIDNMAFTSFRYYLP